jgi:hypothetical protein
MYLTSFLKYTQNVINEHICCRISSIMWGGLFGCTARNSTHVAAQRRKNYGPKTGSSPQRFQSSQW